MRSCQWRWTKPTPASAATVQMSGKGTILSPFALSRQELEKLDLKLCRFKVRFSSPTLDLVDQLRGNWGGVPCTTFSRSDSSSKRRKRLRCGGYGAMQWNNYRDGNDPVRRPMHAAGTVKGDAAREGDWIAEVILWVCRHSGESWAIANLFGQLRYRPCMQKVSRHDWTIAVLQTKTKLPLLSGWQKWWQKLTLRAPPLARRWALSYYL